MTIISLRGISCFSEDASFARLASNMAAHSQFMPHELAGVTGCHLNEATGLLILLLNRGAMTAQILVYHNTHLHDPVSIAAVDLLEGFPELPIECTVCDQILTEQDELSYDFLFTKLGNIEFTR